MNDLGEIARRKNLALQRAYREKAVNRSFEDAYRHGVSHQQGGLEQNANEQPQAEPGHF